MQVGAVNIFVTVVGVLLALSSSLYFLRVRSPASAALGLPKMFVTHGVLFVAGAGVLVTVLGLATGSGLAAVCGAVSVAAALDYLVRVASPHDGFERAFGRDWWQRLGPDRRRAMLPRRWVGRLPDGPQARWQRDIVFWCLPDTNRELLCDVWQPPPGSPSSRVAFLYFHGSGWHWLDKDFNTRRFFRHLCAQGHVVMDVAYRLCPEVDLKGMLGDVKRAVAWMKDHAAEYGVDPHRVALGGGSAGGHLALLAAYAPDHPELTPDELRGRDLSVAAVASYYGPVDMRAYYDHAGATQGFGEPAKKRSRDGIISRLSEAVAKRVLGDLFERIKDQEFGIGHRRMMANLLGGQPAEVPERYTLASPIIHASPGSPPTLLLQGEHDDLVPAAACRALHRKLRHLGVPSVYVEYPQTAHAFDVAILTRYSPAAQAALYELERFLALV